MTELPRGRRKPGIRGRGDAFQALVEALPDAILVLVNGRASYANPAMHALLDTPSLAVVTDRPLADLLAAGSQQQIAAVDRVAAGESADDDRFEIWWQRRDGEPIATECTVGRVTWNGRPAVQIVARRITPRLLGEATLRRAGAWVAKRLNEGRAELTESHRRLGSETVLRERAELDRDVVQARLVVAGERERSRLSRELHDQVGQHLTSLLLGLQGIIDVAGIGSEVDKRAKALHLLAQRLGRDLHDVAVRLRPKALDDFGVEAALRSYATLWSRESGIEAQIQTTGSQTRLPDTVETALYRIAQEALTNVARHSHATRVSVLLDKGDGMSRLTIEDDGNGFTLSPARPREREVAGLGLLGIRERVRQLGGRVDIESAPGRGTTVFVQIPSILPDSHPAEATAL